jgi:hypothetical protein
MDIAGGEVSVQGLLKRERVVARVSDRHRDAQGLAQRDRQLGAERVVP